MPGCYRGCLTRNINRLSRAVATRASSLAVITIISLHFQKCAIILNEAVVTLRVSPSGPGVMAALIFTPLTIAVILPSPAQPNRTQPNMNSICLIMN